MNTIAAIIVTYNRKQLLKECIDNLLKSTIDFFDVLIIDNGSTDGTKELVDGYGANQRVRYFNTGKNLGGAGGFNYGMKIAVKENYEYIWISDDDTMVKPDTLEKLYNANLELKGDYGFLSSPAYWTDGNICMMNRQKVSLSHVITDYESKFVPIIMATFVSFFIKTETVRKFGYPISDFFIWSDDLEYSRRISRSMKCYVVNESTVVHKMGSNNKVGIEHESADRMWRYECMYRNENYVYRREGFKGLCYYYLRVLVHCQRVIFKASDKKQKLKVIFSSVKNGRKFNPKVELVDNEN